jgi:hypothetical protein
MYEIRMFAKKTSFFPIDSLPSLPIFGSEKRNSTVCPASGYFRVFSPENNHKKYPPLFFLADGCQYKKLVT